MAGSAVRCFGRSHGRIHLWQKVASPLQRLVIRNSRASEAKLERPGHPYQPQPYRQMRSKRDRLLTMQLVPLSPHDQKADHRRKDSHQEQEGQSLDTDPERGCCHKFNVSEPEPVKSS